MLDPRKKTTSFSGLAEISANASQIRNVIRKNPGEPNFMPLGGQKLADSLIQEFGCWIEQGLQDN